MFVTVAEAKRLIEMGKILHIAGDESLLKELPKGNWIGGTTPYFITEKGGITCKDRLIVDEIPFAIESKTIIYDNDNILNIGKDAYDNGITFLIMPFASEVAIHYSKESPNIEDLLMTPIIGWISGFDLSEGGQAKVYDGAAGLCYTDKAIGLHVKLSDQKIATLGIVNIFDVNEMEAKIEFLEDTLSVQNCLVNGKEIVFADYIAENNIDTQLPLVADYNSVLINVSIKSISEESKTVELYAPVFKGKEYYFAKPIQDYSEGFREKLKGFNETQPIFSCNCILNYLYGNLDGKVTPPFTGAVTFGEVAYQLLNQTLVYAEILDK